ncbi:hypothetical protein [Chloroflexus sp.]|uniref:hypothetical protein n=1 Tax=Chloroflexus sp. TaxID=1904827 RepID=UPI00261C5979|nr:hypothetical protein [uncultured Chloroflexus sp.]
MASQLTLNLELPDSPLMTSNVSSTSAPSVIFRDSAFEQNKQDAIHRWIPWIAGFSARFVADILDYYLPNASHTVRVLDPFAGVGTTLVESLRRGYHSIGFEVNPFAALASRVKSSAFTIDPQEFWNTISVFENEARQRTSALDRAFAHGDDPAHCLPEPTSRPPMNFRSRVPFFSPTVERKILHCLDIVREIPQTQIREIALLAIGSILVQVSNYSYEPSLTSRMAAGKENILNADVVGMVSAKLRAMHDDIVIYRSEMEKFTPYPTVEVFNRSSLHVQHILPAEHVDIVITSPPYLNNYHYIRNTRPHLFWLNLVSDSADLRTIEQANFGKYWQTVRDSQPAQLTFRLPALEEVIDAIAARNPEKGIYGGRGWANYAITYFNDCYQMGRNLQYVLKPQAVAVFVLGNSIMQGIEIPTDQFFAEIGQLCGLQREAIHVLRAKRVGNSIINSSVRNGQTTGVTLYETAVVLRKP